MGKSASWVFLAVLLAADGLAVSLVRMRQRRNIDTEGPVCRNGDWLVMIEGIPECVKPLWNTMYDQRYCKRVLDGWVTCSCKPGYQLAAVENTVDSCVDSDTIQEGGYCILEPCPEGYECRDIERYRFDCIKGNIIVPNWYSSISNINRKKFPAI